MTNHCIRTITREQQWIVRSNSLIPEHMHNLMPAISITTARPWESLNNEMLANKPQNRNTRRGARPKETQNETRSREAHHACSSTTT
jgi:hypothetical protein